MKRQQHHRHGGAGWLVVGDRDGWNPVDVVAELRDALPDAALWVIPYQGHGAIWDSPRSAAEFPVAVHAFFEGRLAEL